MRAAGSRVLLVALATSGCGGDGGDVRDVTAEERGEALFGDVSIGREGNVVACRDCHATDEAEADRRRPGRPLMRVVDRPTYWGGQEEDLLDAVNECLFWFMGRSTPWTVDDPDGVDLYAYLATLEGDDTWAAPQPLTIGEVAWPGAGDAARGEALYEATCGWCHGGRSTGDGRLVPSAPVLPDDTLERHPPDLYTAEERRLVFVEKTRHGPFLGYGGTMPPITLETLDDAALADVLAYLEVP